MEQEIDDPILAKLNSKKATPTGDDPILKKLNATVKKKDGTPSPEAKPIQNQSSPSSQEPSKKGFLGTIADAYDELIASYKTPAPDAAEKPSPILNAVKRGLNLGSQAEIISPFSKEKPSEEKLQQLAAMQKENQELPASPAYDKFNSSKTVKESLLSLAENPVQIIGELTVESLAGLSNYGASRMATGALTGGVAGSVVPGIGTAAGAGSGIIAGLADTSLALEFTGSFIESLQSAGIDVTDPNQLQKAFEDDKLISEARSHAYKKGIPIAIFDLISGGIAGKIATQPAKSLTKKIILGAGELGSQGVLGGAGELTGQVTAGEEVNPSAIIAEMIGELGTTPIEVSSNLLGRAKKTVQEVSKEVPAPSAPTEQSPVQQQPVTPEAPTPITKEDVQTIVDTAQPENKLTTPEIQAQRNTVKESIHSIAKEIGIDTDTKEFKAISKEITGKSHLDKMNTRHLGQMLQYIQGEKEVSEGTTLFNEFLQDEESQKQPREVGREGEIQQDAPQEGIQVQEDEKITPTTNEKEGQKEGLLKPETPEVVAGKSTTIVETPKQQNDASSKTQNYRGEKTQKITTRTGELKTGSPVSTKEAGIEDSKVNVAALKAGHKIGADKLQGGQLVDENGNPLKLADTKAKKSIKYKVGDALIALPGNPRTQAQAQRTLEIMQKGAGMDVKISARVKPNIRQNVMQKYDIKVGDVKGALLKFFAQGGFLNKKEAVGRMGHSAKEMIGWVAATGTSYDELIQQISEETGVPVGQIDNGKFHDIVDNIISQPKKNVFKQLENYLEKGTEQKEISIAFYDENGKFDDEKFLDALKEDPETVKELLGVTSDEEFNVLIASSMEAVKASKNEAQFKNYLESLSDEQLDQLYNEQQAAFQGGENQAIDKPSAETETKPATGERSDTGAKESTRQRGLAERIRSAIRSLRGAKTTEERVKIAKQIASDTGKYLLNRQGVITGTDASFADNKSSTFFDLIDEGKSVYLLDEDSKIAETTEDYQKINAKLKDKVTIVNGSILFDEAFSNGAIQAAKDLGYDAIRLTEIDGTNSTLQILNFDKLTHITGEDFVANRILPKGPHQIEAEARVKKAEQSVKNATEAIAKKKAQLAKSLAQDQLDLMGNRIGDEGKMFQEGAGDRAAAKKQLDALNKDLEKAKQELEKAHKALEVAKEADKNTLFKSKDEKANDLLADGFSDLADVLGAKKNITGSNAKLSEALVKIGKGLILKGEATIDNVVDKIKDFLKGKGITLSEVELKEIKSEIKKQISPKKKKDKGTEGLKKKSVFKRLDFAKAEIKKIYGENYKPQSNDETKKLTDEFIKQMGGIDKAFIAKESVHPAVKAILYVEKMESLKAQMDTNKDAMAEYMQLMNEFDLMAREGGQAIQILDYIYQNYGMMFTAENQIKKFKEANNGHIPAEMAVKFKELEKKHEELEAKVKKLQEEKDQMQGQIDMMNIKQANKRSGNIRKQNAQKMIKEAQDERSKLWKELTKLSSARAEIVPVTAVTYGVKIANTFIKEGFARGVIGIEEVMEKTKAFWKQATGTDLSDAELTAIRKDIEPSFTFGVFKISHDWIKDLVQQGFDTIEKLVPEVMKELKKEYPDVTERQVRDLITGYGKMVNQSKDDIDILVRKIKRFGRIKSIIEDLNNKKRPLKSGLQRDKPDVQERSLMREIRELLKDVPVDDVTESNQLKTALDAKKTRLKNRIDDLNDALKKGKKLANKEQALTDEEIEELTALRDFNQAIYDEVFKGEKTDQRINRLIKGYEAAIEKIRYRIENLDQEIVTARKDEIKEPIVKEMKERLDTLLKMYNEMREDAGLAELDRLDNLIANAEKITKKYEEKLKNGDFSRRIMKTSYLGAETGVYQAQLDEMKDRLKYAENKAEAQKEIDTLTKFISKIEELQKVQAERQRVRDEFTKEQLKNELENREKWEKNLDKFLDAASIPRQLNAGFEFSSVFIQGRTYTIHFAKQDILSAAKQLLTGKKQEYHTIKNFADMFKSWWSQETHDLNTDKLKSNDAWNRAKQSKLAIHDKDITEEAKTEARGKAGGEILSTKLISTIFDKLALPLKWLGFDKTYKKWTDINLSKKFERSAQMYLNAVRFQRYLQLEEKIRKEGKNFISNPDDYKQAASAINTLSGATNVGVFEGKFMKWSPIFFYSFRMMASVLKQVSPLAFLHLLQLHAKGDPLMKPSVAQKAAVSDFAVSVGLQAMLMVSFAAMMQSATGDDDDWTVELDPRSSKFMQIRVKGKDGHVTYIDAWGGLRTAIVLQMRILSGEVKNRKGELKGLGSRNVPTGKDLVTDYVINKASPLMQPVWYRLARKQKENRNTGETVYTDEYGNEFAFANEVSEKLYPMYFNSIYEMKDTQTPEMAAFGALIGLFGVNTNTYDESPKKK